MSKESNKLSAREMVAEIKAGRLTSEKLVRDCLARIEAREDTVHAWAYLDADAALRTAREIDAGGWRGPLHGIPVGIKNIMDTCDMPTEYGSSMYVGHRPAADAACVSLLRKAGAIVLGKTVTTEFAMGRAYDTTNPHNPAHTPGGSSSGSAAAVADWMVPLALGSQTGGSTIRPASYCGIVALKPSFNTINPTGVKPIAASLDTVGILARSCDDASLMYEAMTGAGSQAPLAKPPKLAFYRTPQWDHAEAYTKDAIQAAVAALGRVCDIRKVTLPAPFEQILKSHNIIRHYEGARAFSYEREHFYEQFSPKAQAEFVKADKRTHAEYISSVLHARECRRLLQEAFGEYDALVVPSAPGVAPPGLESTGNAIFNQIWTVLHVPAVTVPVLKGPLGLPLGLQLIGAYGADQKLLPCAAWVQSALTSSSTR